MLKSGIKNWILRTYGMLLLINTPYCSSAQKKYYPDKKYSPELLKNDARIIKNVLLAMHPAIGIYQPKKYYEKLLDQLIASISDSLSEKQFRLKLKLVVDELHCGHTEVMQSKSYMNYFKTAKLNFLPYYLISVGHQAFVGVSMQPKKDTVLKMGAEILKINHIRVDSIINYSMHFISGDGYSTTGKQLFLRSGLNYSYPSLFGRPDSFLIEYKINNKLQNQWVKAACLKELPIKPLLPVEDSTLKKFRRANISAGYMDESKKTMILKIKSFRPLKYKRIYRRLFRQMEKEKTENLVLDLRFNGGGNLMNSYRLLSYLIDKPQTVTLSTLVKNYPEKKYTHGNLGFWLTRWTLSMEGKKTKRNNSFFYTHTIHPSKKHPYKGNIVVLINGGTFSASCIVSTYLKEMQRAVFVGTETGGTIEGCNAGVTPYYTLPATKIKIRVPAFRIIHDIHPQVSGKGIEPDYPVNYSLTDLLGRKDLEIKKAKELINK